MPSQTVPALQHPSAEPSDPSNVLLARRNPGRPVLAFAAFSVLAFATAGSVSWYGASALSLAAAPVAVIVLALYFTSVWLKSEK